MTKTIAIGVLGLALVHSPAVAQTAAEQAQILRDFHRNVANYTQPEACLDAPEALSAGSPAPRIFTLPVAMVFRQMIAKALVERDGVAVIRGVGIPHSVTVLEPFPAHELAEFPRALRDTLPVLPAPLEYRLIGNDLVLRDTNTDVVVAVLRDAVGGVATVRR
jgi:hypothetical protein